LTDLPTLTDLMTDPGELVVTCLDCHHNTTMAVATFGRLIRLLGL